MQPIPAIVTLLSISLIASQSSAQPATRPVPLEVKWTAMPIRSERQFQLAMPGGEGGQCLHGIARSPSDDKRIYLAVDVVGVWRSTDGGHSWEPCRNQGLFAIGTSSIAVHPRNPDHLLVYADAAWEKPREPEEGLYQSADGGQTWARVIAAPNTDTRRGYRHLIEFSPDGRRAYFGAYDRGLYRSDNGGLDWQGPLSLKGTPLWELRVDPRNPDLLWAAAEDGLHLSRNGGKDFARVDPAGQSPITSITPDPAVPDRIHIVRHGEGLFRSDDAGKTFTQLRSGDKDLDQKARHLFQSPLDPRRMILAAETKMRITHDAGKIWREPKIDWSRSFVQQGSWGFTNGMSWSARELNRVVGGLSCGMYASTDGGLTWTDSMAGYTGFHHGWSDGAVSFAPDDPDRFAFFCYDYAFNLTRDGGRTFVNGRLKEKVRDWWGMYVGDMHPDWKKQPVVVAAAGNYWKNQLVRSEDAGKSWNPIPDTDGAYFFIRFHPADPRIVYADDRRSDDGGKTFRKLAHPVYAFAPGRPDTVYGYGEGTVWRSDDRGDTWRALPAPPKPAGEHMGRRDIEVDPRNPDIVWAMTPPDCAVFDGTRWRTIQASAWADRRSHAFVNRMAIDPGRPQRVIIGLDAHGAGYLFLSDDAGITWRDITGNLPRLGSNQSLNIQPRTGRIFIGAGFGTWTATVPGQGGMRQETRDMRQETLGK